MAENDKSGCGRFNDDVLPACVVKYNNEKALSGKKSEWLKKATPSQLFEVRKILNDELQHKSSVLVGNFQVGDWMNAQDYDWDALALRARVGQLGVAIDLLDSGSFNDEKLLGMLSFEDLLKIFS